VVSEPATITIVAPCHERLDTPDINARTRDTQLTLILGFSLRVFVDTAIDSNEVSVVPVTHSATLTNISKIISFLLQIISNYKEVFYQVTFNPLTI
jgi:hypothetical protein